MTMPAPPPRFLAILWTLAAVLLAAGWLSTRGEPAAASAQDTLPLADSIAARGAGAVDTAPAIAPATPAASRAGARVAQARADLDTPLMERLIFDPRDRRHGASGVANVGQPPGVPVARRALGLGLQLVFALFVLRTAPGERSSRSSTTASSS